jgi:hypothetical protein
MAQLAPASFAAQAFERRSPRPKMVLAAPILDGALAAQDETSHALALWRDRKRAWEDGDGSLAARLAAFGASHARSRIPGRLAMS